MACYVQLTIRELLTRVCVWQIAEEQAEVAQLKAQVAQLLAKRKSQAKA